MKTTARIFICTFLALCGISVTGFGQFPEDALRLSMPGLGVGARSLGMGTAYTGVANDFSAAYWNPAGLGQLRMNEFSLGLSHVSFGNTSDFLSNSQSITNSTTSLNNFGLVYSVPTVQGSFVLALGYGRQSDFTTGLSFAGFNPSSSIIQSWAPDGQTYPSDLSNNLAYQLYLANIDTVSGQFVSLINDSVTQSGKILEGGGLNHVSVSAAVEAARNLYVGATLNFITGSYSYTRNYYEDDILNSVYTSNRIPFDFTSLSLLETVESDISGFTAKLGLLYRLAPNSRLGIAVKTPSWITVRETFATRASSDFDNGDHFDYNLDGISQQNEYDVVTPFVFSGGFSYAIRSLMLAADLEYTDWTQMEFRNADPRLLGFNTTIKEEFGSTVNVRLGAEYEFPDAGFRLRGGFAYLPSPYVGDPATFARKYITGGFGFVVEEAFAIDIGYAHGFWDSYRVNYDATSRTNESVKTNNLMATVSYRF